MARYTDQELLKLAIEFQENHGRPPKLKELDLWRTILRHWSDRGNWTGYLHEAEVQTYDEWEYSQRIEALKSVLKEYGELSQKEYNKLVHSKKYHYLPDILTMNRMFNTCELGIEGRVWIKIKELSTQSS